MSERSRVGGVAAAERWIESLGRFLPIRLRELVFEPTCHDLVQASLRRRAQLSRIGLLTSLLWTLAHVALLNFPRVLVDGRKPSRLAIAMATLLLVPGALAAIVMFYARMRAGY